MRAATRRPSATAFKRWLATPFGKLAPPGMPHEAGRRRSKKRKNPRLAWQAGGYAYLGSGTEFFAVVCAMSLSLALLAGTSNRNRRRGRPFFRSRRRYCSRGHDGSGAGGSSARGADGSNARDGSGGGRSRHRIRSPSWLRRWEPLLRRSGQRLRRSGQQLRRSERRSSERPSRSRYRSRSDRDGTTTDGSNVRGADGSSARDGSDDGRRHCRNRKRVLRRSRSHNLRRP